MCQQIPLYLPDVIPTEGQTSAIKRLSEETHCDGAVFLGEEKNDPHFLPLGVFASSSLSSSVGLSEEGESDLTEADFARFPGWISGKAAANQLCEFFLLLKFT